LIKGISAVQPGEEFGFHASVKWSSRPIEGVPVPVGPLWTPNGLIFGSQRDAVIRNRKIWRDAGHLSRNPRLAPPNVCELSRYVFFGLAKFGADERVHAEQFKNSGNGEKGALISCSELKRPLDSASCSRCLRIFASAYRGC